MASYFALRKSSMGRTADGALRPMLNNEFVFQTGMLDQVTRGPTPPVDLP